MFTLLADDPSAARNGQQAHGRVDGDTCIAGAAGLYRLCAVHRIIRAVARRQVGVSRLRVGQRLDHAGGHKSLLRVGQAVIRLAGRVNPSLGGSAHNADGIDLGDRSIRRVLVGLVLYQLGVGRLSGGQGRVVADLGLLGRRQLIPFLQSLHYVLLRRPQLFHLVHPDIS